MRSTQRRRRASERDVQRPPTTAGDSATDSRLFRLGRTIFGGILAFMAVDNLRNLDERVAYAEAKGAPNPDVSVPAISAGLLFGSVGVARWRRPSLSAAAVASFFAGVTPVMHDFWNLDDPEERQQQFTDFLKNAALFGASLAFLALGRQRDRPR